MRRGRRRKVRCSYPTPSASVCVHCARRKTVCIPQGSIRHASVTIASPDLDNQPTFDPDHAPFFKTLHQLRQRIEVSFRGTAPSHDNRTSSWEPLQDPGMVQSNCAPVIKLLSHELIGRRTESLHNQASRRDADFVASSKPGDYLDPIQPTEHASVLYEMWRVIPPDPDVAEIFTTRGRWWGTWRRSFGLAWGEDEDRTLSQFATRAVRAANPSLLGSLLLCFALSTGDFGRYLAPVERWILADNFFSTHVYDFQCLMGLGLCFLGAVQPRCAWMVYRKANALLQLGGIHRSHRRSERLDLIFWELFGADRWVSLLIGLPNSVPDRLCHLAIASIDQSDPVTFHHRHMVLLTGRIIDCLQSPTGFSFTAVVSVDEEIDKITAQLPLNYLSMSDIAASPDADERSARLYRVAEVFQLKTFLYLPLFLRGCDRNTQQLARGQTMRYGRTACVGSARSLLEAYLALYDIDPATAAVDNSMKLASFTALTAAVVLLLNLLASAHPTMRSMAYSLGISEPQSDIILINRAAAVFEAFSEGQPGSLCGQCHTALVDLIFCSQKLSIGESREIRVPYFGILEITRNEQRDSLDSSRIHLNDKIVHQSPSTMVDPIASSLAADVNANDVFPTLPVADDVFFSYHGPWESHQQDSDLFAESTEAGFDSINLVSDRCLAPEFLM